MGFNFSGIIFKNAAGMSDEDILEVLEEKGAIPFGDASLEEATSVDFKGTGIVWDGNMAIVLGPFVAYSCSLEEEEDLTATDETLERLSVDGDIFCFLINSTSGTFACSLFSHGKRTRVNTYVDGAAAEPGGPPMDEQGMIRLIEQFTGRKFINLLYESGLTARQYIR